MLMYCKSQHCKNVRSSQNVYIVNKIAIKITFLMDLDKMFLKFTWKCKDSKIAKALLKEKIVGGLELLYIKPNP